MDIGKLQPSPPPLAGDSAVSTPPKPAVGREPADLGKIPDLPPDRIMEGKALSLGQSALAGLDLGPVHPDFAGAASPPTQPMPPSDPPPTDPPPEDPSRLGGASHMTASSLLAGVNLSRHHPDQSRMPAPAATDVGDEKPAPPPPDDARIRGFSETKAAGDLVKGLLHQQLSAKLPEAVPHPGGLKPLPGGPEGDAGGHEIEDAHRLYQPKPEPPVGPKTGPAAEAAQGAAAFAARSPLRPDVNVDLPAQGGLYHPAPEPPPRPDSGSLEAGGKSSGMSSDLTGADHFGVVVED